MLYMKEMRAKVVAECTLKESAAINQILGRRVSRWKNYIRFVYRSVLLCNVGDTARLHQGLYEFLLDKDYSFHYEICICHYVHLSDLIL